MRFLLLFLTFCSIANAETAQDFLDSHKDDPRARYGTTTPDWENVDKGQTIAGSRRLFTMDALTQLHQRQVKTEAKAVDLNSPHKVIDPLAAAVAFMRDKDTTVTGKATTESDKAYLNHALRHGANTAAIYGKSMNSFAAWEFFTTDYGVVAAESAINTLRTQLSALACLGHLLFSKTAKDLEAAKEHVNGMASTWASSMDPLKQWMLGFTSKYSDVINAFCKELHAGIGNNLLEIYAPAEVKVGKSKTKASLPQQKNFFNTEDGEMLSPPRTLFVGVTEEDSGIESKAVMSAVDEAVREYASTKAGAKFVEKLAAGKVALDSPQQWQNAIVAFVASEVLASAAKGKTIFSHGIFKHQIFSLWLKPKEKAVDGVVLTQFLVVDETPSSSPSSSRSASPEGRKDPVSSSDSSSSGSSSLSSSTASSTSSASPSTTVKGKGGEDGGPKKKKKKKGGRK